MKTTKISNIEKIYNTLTNGIDEKPYWERRDGQIKLFVSDEQEFCTIPIDDCDEDIAIAICNAGNIIKGLKDKLERYKKFKKEVSQIDWDYLRPYHIPGLREIVEKSKKRI